MPAREPGDGAGDPSRRRIAAGCRSPRRGAERERIPPAADPAIAARRIECPCQSVRRVCRTATRGERRMTISSAIAMQVSAEPLPEEAPAEAVELAAQAVNSATAAATG